MTRLVAEIPIGEAPSWAVWQRRMLDDCGKVVHSYLDHFTREEGEFIWEDEWGGGSPDDYFEPYFNWPLVYAMGPDAPVGGRRAVLPPLPGQSPPAA